MKSIWEDTPLASASIRAERVEQGPASGGLWLSPLQFGKHLVQAGEQEIARVSVIVDDVEHFADVVG